MKKCLDTNKVTPRGDDVLKWLRAQPGKTFSRGRVSYKAVMLERGVVDLAEGTGLSRRTVYNVLPNLVLAKKVKLVRLPIRSRLRPLRVEVKL